MHKSQASEFLPIVKAMAEGKMVERRVGSRWVPTDSLPADAVPSEYRVKPPSNDHQPVGWFDPLETSVVYAFSFTPTTQHTVPVYRRNEPLEKPVF